MTSNAYSLLTILLGGGIITAAIAVLKFKPERDSVIVSSAQNATQILKTLNENLQEELDRQRVRANELEISEAKLEATVTQLQTEIGRLQETIYQLQELLRNSPPPN